MNRPNAKSCVLRERKTRFVEIFRTTPVNTVCPNFYVLSHANGCTFSPRCSYCYLESSFWYLDKPQVFTNIDRMVQDIRKWLGQEDLESYVLNTGNLCDSLASEEVRPLVARLVQLFREEAQNKGRSHCLLLVTKGGLAQCRSLLELKPCPNVIVSFSVNSPQAAETHERGAAPVDDRLAAAHTLKDLGWRVRMRIDPMILGFDYAWIIDQVRRFRPERVTLGALRADAALLRFIGNGVLAELQAPETPKALARYPRPKRIELYSQAVAALRDVCPVALCEETPDVWQELGLDIEKKSCNCGL